MSNRFNLDLVNWEEIRIIAQMIEGRKMERGDLKFGPTKVTIYDITGQSTLRIDIRVED